MKVCGGMIEEDGTLSSSSKSLDHIYVESPKMALQSGFESAIVIIMAVSRRWT